MSLFGLKEIKERLLLLEYENEILASKLNNKNKKKSCESIPHINTAELSHDYAILRKRYRKYKAIFYDGLSV